MRRCEICRDFFAQDSLVLGRTVGHEVCARLVRERRQRAWRAAAAASCRARRAEKRAARRFLRQAEAA